MSEPADPDSPASGSPQLDPRSVGSFITRYQAELAYGRLTAEGIDARIVSASRRGPWRVMVPGGAEERSRELLRADYSALVDELFRDDPDPSDLPDGVCPRCGAPEAVDLRANPGILFAILGRPFWLSRWRCAQCKLRWR